MAAWKKITVQPNLLSRLGRYDENKPEECYVPCEHCGKPIYVGNEAWSHLCPRKGESFTELWCRLCYNKLWI